VAIAQVIPNAAYIVVINDMALRTPT